MHGDGNLCAKKKKKVPFPSLAGLTAMIRLDPHTVGMDKKFGASRTTFKDNMA